MRLAAVALTAYLSYPPTDLVALCPFLPAARAFGEFCFASVILHWFAFNFLG